MLDWERLGKTVRTMVWLCTKQFVISQNRANRWKISVPPYLPCLHNQLFLFLILIGREGILSLTSTLPSSLLSSDALPSELPSAHSGLDFSIFTSYIPSSWPGSAEENKLLLLHRTPQDCILDPCSSFSNSSSLPSLFFTPALHFQPFEAIPSDPSLHLFYFDQCLPPAL